MNRSLVASVLRVFTFTLALQLLTTTGFSGTVPTKRRHRPHPYYGDPAGRAGRRLPAVFHGEGERRAGGAEREADSGIDEVSRRRPENGSHLRAGAFEQLLLRHSRPETWF